MTEKYFTNIKFAAVPMKFVTLTDFKEPEDSLSVLQSEENRVWFAFKKQEKEYKTQIKE